MVLPPAYHQKCSLRQLVLKTDVTLLQVANIAVKTDAPSSSL